MYYKKRSKVNWPVIITVGVAVFFLAIIITILTRNFLNAKKDTTVDRVQANTAAPKIELSLNTEEPNQSQVLIKVKISTGDPDGLAKIIIPGASEIILEENQTKYETTFAAVKNAIYEIQAYGKNGVFGSGRVTVSNIQRYSAREPYIPEGFTKVDGTDVNTGLVIKDQSGNEYVWIPAEDGRLVRNRSETDSTYYESDAELQFRNSVAKYHGFYIGRYEANVLSSGGKEIAGIRAGVLPADRITYKKAEKLSKEAAEVYNYKGHQTTLISSSAWDTALAWIERALPGYSSSVNYGNYSGRLLPNGENSKDQMANIFDLSGNLREWTSESYRLNEEERRSLAKLENIEVDAVEDQKIIRGGSASNSSTPNRSLRGNPNSAYEHTGFRYILFKD